jgi:hypothetical protein
VNTGTTAQDAYRLMLREHIAPALRELGFRRGPSLGAFRYETATHAAEGAVPEVPLQQRGGSGCSAGPAKNAAAKHCEPPPPKTKTSKSAGSPDTLSDSLTEGGTRHRFPVRSAQKRSNDA